MAEEPRTKSDNNVDDRITGPLKEVGEVLKEARNRASEHNETISLRVIEFAERNMNETFEALRAATRAKDVGEVLAVQGSFLRDQMNRSLEQFRELSELLNKAGSETMQPVTSRISRSKSR